MQLRLRGPSGQISLNLEESTTFAQFRVLISENLGVPPQNQEICGGFPPIPLPIIKRVEATATGVRTAGSATQETPSLFEEPEDSILAQAIALSLDPAQQASTSIPTPTPMSTSAPTTTNATVHTPTPTLISTSAPVGTCMQQSNTVAPGEGCIPGPLQQDGRGEDLGRVVRRVIDSDNSCLFNAVGYVMERSRSVAPKLRGVIADAVSKDPVTYNEAVLGKSPEEYCKWILLPDKWGGAIELSILSDYYKREIAAYDIQTLRCDCYGQDGGHPERGMLIYDGLHYDALALEPFPQAPEEVDCTIFDTASSLLAYVAKDAHRVVSEAHQTKQFTDTHNFSLRCAVCQLGLKGQKEVVDHAKATGHGNFCEY
mmetsp:Transcript_16465/g.22759  ORF Transcript_16465/g.22759 Transcript_16465/m.22759 type:complete len:371 (-) Transcript_16465:28-1140(-)